MQMLIVNENIASLFGTVGNIVCYSVSAGVLFLDWFVKWDAFKKKWVWPEKLKSQQCIMFLELADISRDNSHSESYNKTALLYNVVERSQTDKTAPWHSGLFEDSCHIEYIFKNLFAVLPFSLQAAKC